MQTYFHGTMTIPVVTTSATATFYLTYDNVVVGGDGVVAYRITTSVQCHIEGLSCIHRHETEYNYSFSEAL